MDDQKKILIVDDVEANRFVLRNIISEMGHLPVLAENGVQSLKIMEKIKPNLILLDVAMPEMDGYELCRILKDDPVTRKIPIIFISAFDKPDDIIKGFSIGGEDYITKPFMHEVVQARVMVHLKMADMNQELQNVNRKLASSIQEQLKQIEQEKKNVLYALSRVARENSSYDVNHMNRLQYNSKILAQAMQLSPIFESRISDSFIETIELAAPLCDIGNVAIPSGILQKNGSLTEKEQEVMETHTTVGAKILKDVQEQGDYNDFVQMSIDIANFHHENWDGTGYPQNLSGDEIPLSAQIVALVSAYCALTEERIYRKAFTRANAIEILEGEAGTKFNSAVFDICRRVSKQFK